MKASLLTTAAVIAGLTIGHGARAQLPVIDGANLAQTTQAVLTAGKELAQLQAQLLTLVNTYRMFTSPSAITAMLPGLNSSFLQNPMPAAGSTANPSARGWRPEARSERLGCFAARPGAGPTAPQLRSRRRTGDPGRRCLGCSLSVPPMDWLRDPTSCYPANQGKSSVAWSKIAGQAKPV